MIHVIRTNLPDNQWLDFGENIMTEAIRIMNCAARIPIFHGSTTADVVDEILASCGGQIVCNGRLREFIFTKITEKSFTFKTENWYEKNS